MKNGSQTQESQANSAIPRQSPAPRQFQVSLIIPVWNGERSIARAISETRSALMESGFTDFEIIVAEDCSTDRTPELALGMAGKWKEVRIMRSPDGKRRGKGKSISDAINSSRGEKVIFIDVDLSPSVSCIPKLLAALDRADIAVGSRFLPESQVQRGVFRGFSSTVYNSLARALFGSGLRDHQCGFKAFKKSSVLPVLGGVKDGCWFWDTELLVRAKKAGLAISEIPIAWKEGKGSTFNVFLGPIGLFFSLLRLYLDLHFSEGLYK